ncbi:MAG: SGNH/GDSL hydrolase family protein, partial [Thermoleophilia bacterium]|nr:SGNH/GDSL hydrolase family protein [Thermoleophilia bacterium]
PPALLLLLLLARAAWPDSALVLGLTGRGRIDGELGQAQTRGYYESLLGDDSAQRARLAAPDVRPEADIERPPPGWVAFADSGIVETRTDFERWRLRPNVDTTWNGMPFRTNSHGHRSPEVATAKPPGTYRVVVLGSSNTMGHGVGDDAIYVRPFEAWLNSKLAGSGRRAEVLNLAVSSDAPSQRLLRLRRDVAAWQPDWVICDATVLDMSLEATHLESLVRRGVPIPPDFEYVSKALAESGATAADAPEVFRGKVRSAYLTLLGGAYAGWSAEARRLGVPLTVLLIPRADKVSRNPELVRLTRTLCTRNNLDLIDASDAFRGLTLEDFRVSAWDR